MNRRQWPLLAVLVLLGVFGVGAWRSQAVLPQDLRSANVIVTGVRLPLGLGVKNVSLIVEPDDTVRPLTAAIRGAARSVDLMMYLLTNRPLIRALEYAHAQGVSERVLLERSPYGASDAVNIKAFNTLAAADIPVAWTSPQFKLTHAKLMIIDRQTAYVMNSNFTASAFRSNREFDVVDHAGADVRSLDELFTNDWRKTAYHPSDSNLVVSPTDSRYLLTALLTSARYTVDMYAEELQDRRIERVLVNDVARGVRVRLILPSSTAPSSRDMQFVTHGGVKVHFESTLFIHAKAIVVDGSHAYIGSENISSASLDRNREVGVIFSNSSTIQRLQHTFEHDWLAL